MNNIVRFMYKWLIWLLLSGILMATVSCGSGGSSSGNAIGNSSAKSITSFSINNITGTINNNNISVTVPYGTDVTNLVATFITTGKSVTVKGIMV